MQIFITDQFTKQDRFLTITDERVLYQCTKVLRYTEGDEIIIQSKGQRFTTSIDSRDKKSMKVKILMEESQPKKSGDDTTLTVAMTNKRDKMELICQKASEIGIGKILIRISKRSVIQDLSENKISRINLICVEAAEQSHNRSVPQIQTVKKINDIPKGYLAYQDGAFHSEFQKNNEDLNNIIVGPEGGFEPTELKYFQENDYPSIKLGESILRTESAAIIGAWWLKNKTR
jgi:16S rRNA (uracil1498-N3)-methyltransferase